MNDIINQKRGSLIVETAIFLPLFIIGVLTLAYLLKTFYIQEAVHHAFVDEAKKTAVEAYIHDLKVIPDCIPKDILDNGLKDNVLFEYRIKQRINEEKIKDIETFKVTRFKYLYNNLEQLLETNHHLNQYSIDTDDLIDIIIQYDAKLPFAIKYKEKLHISQRLVFRGWTGSKHSSNPISFDSMEKNENSTTVYIFPKAGQKYHRATCKIITNCPVQKVLSQSIMSRYKACELCNANKASEGCIIYLYPKTGAVYHLKNCPLVDKYIIKIQLRDAISKGYGPCQKCKPPTKE